MDDSTMYTGVDGVDEGVFGNEQIEDSTKQLLDEQRQKLAELTPKLKDINDMLDKEIDSVNSIKRFKTAASSPESDIRSELQAAALYEDYLQNLKTKFALALNETKGKK